VPATALAGVLAGAKRAESHSERPRETAVTHPNVLVLLVDALRADHTSLRGYHRDTTPNLVEFAREGLDFTRVWAPTSWTKPSVASLFTGLLPAIHTAENRNARLPDEAATLAEVLHAAGYRTAMFSDNYFISRDFGFDQGFDHVVDPVDTTDLGFANRLMRIGRFRLPRQSLLGHALDAFFPHRRDPLEIHAEDEKLGAPVLNRLFLE
jgi:hypothetical protein